MKSLLATALALGLATPVLADDASTAMGAFLDENVAPWATDPVLVDAIRAQNEAHAGLTQANIDAMDQAWRNEVGQADTPTISRVIDSAASDFLRARVDASAGAITEVFIMDDHGLNVAASATTSDFWQGDEAKFSETYGVGADARHFSEIEKDESTRSYQGQASFAITDPDSGEVIGAMTVGINAEALF
ncbi:cache domain-containing protein [Maritimibacter alexandrii]|uniref:cache domain-containing protein n=1 Tax=Maritimibacter alexandrii TaxID=2570355 RepID=UPI001109A439|nr:cache domain-containing protein [Maritimibacter alexandrii]